MSEGLLASKGVLCAMELVIKLVLCEEHQVCTTEFCIFFVTPRGDVYMCKLYKHYQQGTPQQVDLLLNPKYTCFGQPPPPGIIYPRVKGWL